MKKRHFYLFLVQAKRGVLKGKRGPGSRPRRGQGNALLNEKWGRSIKTQIAIRDKRVY